MDDSWRIKVATGEAQEKLAEGWFTYLGFLAITAVFHAVAETSGMPGFIAFKWICYLALWRWVMFKVDQMIWVCHPNADPRNERLSPKTLFWSLFISTNVAGFSYFISLQAIGIINALGAK